MPELTHEFLHHFGGPLGEQFKELIRVVLKRRLEYLQRQSARQQSWSILPTTANWDLPQDLLQRQARRAMHRRIMEMRSGSLSETEISGRLRLLQQDILQSTALALKEHFVLQKIAEVEKLDIDDDDIDAEIDRLAETTRRFAAPRPARLEKEDMMEGARRGIDREQDARPDPPERRVPRRAAPRRCAIPGRHGRDRPCPASCVIRWRCRKHRPARRRRPRVKQANQSRDRQGAVKITAPDGRGSDNSSSIRNPVHVRT